MSEWKKVKLGGVAKMMRGKAVTRSSIAPGNIPVMLGGREPAYYCNESNHTGPCFIVSRSGASAGYVSYWDEPIFVTDGFLFDTDSKSDTQFLYYSLKERQQSLIMSQNGTGIPHVRGEDLKNIELAFPTEIERKRIAGILSDYDTAIANCRKQIALLEEAAMRLYCEWFVTHADPKWEKKSIWEVCDYFRGVSYTSKEVERPDGLPLITLKNIERFGGFRQDRSKTFSGHCREDSTVGANDVLMAVTDMTKERRLVGHVALVPDTYNHAPFSMDLIHLKGKIVSDFFLYAMLRYASYAEGFAARASGANVIHLKPSSLDDAKVVVPRKELRENYERVFVPMVRRKNALYRAIQQLTEARDRLLPKLMKGEIEV